MLFEFFCIFQVFYDEYIKFQNLDFRSEGYLKNVYIYSTNYQNLLLFRSTDTYVFDPILACFYFI